MRTGEAAFREAGLDLDTASDDDIIALMISEPSLIQRPIVEIGQSARIGRPPEAVLELLE